MEEQFYRREIVRGIGAGTITATFAGPVTAESEARYLVTARGRRAKRRVESAGFDVEHALAEGAVLLVAGPSSDRGDLEGVEGVDEVARDVRIEVRGPENWARSETTDEDGFSLQWDKRVTDVPAAHDAATGAGTTIAVIDTGVDVDGHPDLPNVDAAAGRQFREGQVRSGTGAVEFPAVVGDPCAGTTTITDHVADDVHYHGTHVAGIAGASREGTTGVVGTAPDARIVPLRAIWWTEADVDCDGDGEVEEDAATLHSTIGHVLLAVDYAAETGADVANMSIGLPPVPPRANAGGVRGAMERVVESATARGTVVVASAGNTGTNLQQGGRFAFPNSAAGAMGVSATGPNDELAFYSSYGTNEIDVGAPGGGYETREKTFCRPDGTVDGCDGNGDCECEPPEWPYPTNHVLSTLDPDSYVGQLAGGAEYLYVAGTSMAAPQVAGTAALVREVAPGATAEQVEQAIEAGADLVRGKSDPELGAGRLNAKGALAADVTR